MGIIQAIQTMTTPFFDVFFILCTLFGEQTLIAVVFAIVYFSVDKRVGKIIGYSLFSSLCFNSVLKGLISAPRPIGVEGIRSIFADSATGSSFPSGHSQGAASTYLVVAQKFKRWWVWALSILLIALVGISRLYLGVHWPKDVLFGWFFGALFAIVIPIAYELWGSRVGLLTLLFLPALFFLKEPDLFKTYGLFLGFVVSISLEEKLINFSMDISFWRKMVRLFFGLGFILIMKTLLGMLFPQTLLFHVMQNFVLAFLGFFIYPLIFTKLKF